ncbi:hypothetical protein PCIT_a1517 [Pseudoalteromonas citrea]|uniref:Dicarboxylate transport domain-containing protein n=3 Tax=Pseudoalteromonas citrea TaxID=43655 RepID=A0AAD4AMP1_9GAMM|nr:hypothetical protein PCIT_a1517 [Pseudoalteromonas citrea]
MLAYVYGYKNVLVRTAVNHFVLPPAFSMSCLSWSFKALNKIEITQLCIESDELSVTVNDAIASFSHVSVAQLDIKHRYSDNPQSEFQAHPLKIPLMDNRPIVHIERITVTSDRLPKPVLLSLHEKDLNEFMVAGDIQAQVTLTNQTVSSSIEFKSPLLQRYSAPYFKGLEGKLLLTYNGLTTQVNADVTANSTFVKPQCRINSKVAGKFSADIDLQVPQALIDLSKVRSEIILDGCKSIVPDSYMDYVQSTFGKPYTIKLPNKLLVTPSTINVPKMIATNADSDEVTIRDLDVQLANMQVRFGGRWHHTSDLFGQLTNDVTVKVQGGQFTSEHQIRFQAAQIALSSTKFAGNTLNAQLLVAGDLAFDSVNISGNGEALSNMINHTDVQLDTVNVAFDVAGSYSGIYQLKANLALNSDVISADDKQLEDLAIETELTIDSLQQLDVIVRSSIAKLDVPAGQVRVIKQQLVMHSEFDINEAKSGDLSIEVNAETNMGSFWLAGVKADDINIHTHGHFNRTLSLEHIVEYADLSVLLEHQLLSQGHPFTITIADQPIMGLQPIVENILPKLQLSAGIMNAKASGDLQAQDASFSAKLKGASVLYDSHYGENINTTLSGEINSGVINIAKSKLTIEQVRSGAVLSNLSADYMLNAQQAILSNIKANVFNGQVYLPQFALFSEQQDLDVSLSNLDLGMLAEAGRDAGIDLSGKISGKLPISLNNGAVSIQNGQLYNVDIGQLLVQNNASVDALKAQQPSLETVIGLLDNLTVNKLMSDVNLTPDGWLTLGVKITGENEAQAQPVNFNYTHSENIFTLFRALRLSDEITQRVEQALTKSE